MKGKTTRRRGLVAVLLLLFLFPGCGDEVSPGTAKVKRQAISGVSVSTVQPATIVDEYETSGTVKAGISSIIASRVMGAVTTVYVRAGEPVKAGQLLAIIDSRDAVQRMRGAEQGRVMADLTYRRYKRLHDEKALSRQEIDQIETSKRVADAGYEQAKAGLEEARLQLGFSRIAAPMAGIVTDRRIDPGSMALPGMHLFTVESQGAFLLEAAVDESLSGKLSVGTSAGISIDALGLTKVGKISEVVPAVDPATRTFLVKIPLTGQGIRSGLFARVRLPLGQRQALLIPKGALVEKGQLTGVYTVDEKGVVTYRLVRTGKPYEGGLEILSGLSAGERIISAGLEKAVDGGQISGGAAR
ncbi:MAG: Multidrug resistance protein MdtA precursor [Syntrophus sp. PtaU1.Bin208]|nr:MAG: Multidrug resistance protein MdtA precursor [Syntrophus sp. PtaU1.Bin208]